MKLNFSVPFADVFGNKMASEQAPTIAKQLAMLCFSATKLKGQDLDAKKKYELYILSGKLATEGEIEITSEEATLLKELAADNFTAGGYGQIHDIIENKETK